MSIKQVINIASWSIEKYENIKKFFKKKFRVWSARSKRKAVDRGDTRSLDKFLRLLSKRRRDRAES